VSSENYAVQCTTAAWYHTSGRLLWHIDEVRRTLEEHTGVDDKLLLLEWNLVGAATGQARHGFAWLIVASGMPRPVPGPGPFAAAQRCGRLAATLSIDDASLGRGPLEPFRAAGSVE
jgi:hypothetical protein